MKVIFWCEFPEKVDWKEAKKIIDFKTEVYVAVKTREEYFKWKNKIKSRNIEVGAWPKLEEKEGYWFSGFTKKESIDKLKQFKGLNIKVDIEPPFPGKGFKAVRLFFTYFLPYFIRKGKNNEYLEEAIKELNGKIIISSFPLPAWLSRRYGDITELRDNMQKNFITYTTLTTRIARWYLRWFAKKMLKKYGEKAMFGLGCTGKGIFGDERTYTNIKKFREDLEMMRKIGAKNIVIFSIEGIMERKERKEWLGEIKTIF